MTATETGWDNQTVRVLERSSIRSFMEESREYLRGRVLDFGAGAQPYRDLVDGDYLPHEKGESLPVGKFDAVMCNQVLQYIPDVPKQIHAFASMLNPGGSLVMTYPTNWDEVEESDLWRFTKMGMERMLATAGLTVIRHERRAAIDLNGFKFPLGYGVIAQRNLSRENLDPDEGAQLMRCKLNRREPFLFIRYGDGALECIYELQSWKTCDGEEYSRELAAGLKWAWDACINAPNVYVGDWLSASFGKDRSSEYRVDYARLINGARPNWLHFESLLLTRESKALIEFYKAVANFPGKKVLVGPEAMAPGAKMLKCQHIVTPMVNLFSHVDALTERLLDADFEVLLYGAGMAGNIPVIRVWEKFPERTYINIGSALDPLYRGRTRSGQLPMAKAQALFRELL